MVPIVTILQSYPCFARCYGYYLHKLPITDFGLQLTLTTRVNSSPIPNNVFSAGDVDAMQSLNKLF